MRVKLGYGGANRFCVLARRRRHLIQKASRFVQKNGGRVDCLPSAVLRFVAEGVPDCAGLGLGVGFGGKVGEWSKPDINPYSQGFPSRPINCK